MGDLMWLAWVIACSGPGSETDEAATVPSADTSTCTEGDDKCDGIDNDCDGLIDEDPDLLWYEDRDGDGQGDPESRILSCQQPSGFLPDGLDCDDDDPKLSGPVGDIRWEMVDAKTSGLDAPHWPDGRRCLQELILGGAAIGDVDADGDLDVFQPRLFAPDQLLLNDGAGHFAVDPSFETDDAPSSGALFVDIDGDRDLDLVVLRLALDPAQLYINDGKGNFTEDARKRGATLDPPFDRCSDQLTVSAADVDGDGFLDLAVGAWLDWDELGDAQRTRMLINDRKGGFDDQTEAWNLGFLDQIGVFTFLFRDIDGDARPDPHIVADWNGTLLMRNTGSSFEPLPSEMFTDENGMGSDFGDIDGDGQLDWFVGAIWDTTPQCLKGGQIWGCSGNRMYSARTTPENGLYYTDVTEDVGVRTGQWTWGTVFADYDLDTDVDLVVTGGYSIFPFVDQTGQIWENDGNGRFTDATCQTNWTFRGHGRTVLPFDADRDGDLDLLLIEAYGPPTLWRATGAEGRSWLELDLDQPGGNRFAIGAEVTVRTTPTARGQVRLLHANSLYMGGPAPEVHFGLGDHTGPLHEVRVRWPDGVETIHTDIEPGRVTITR